MEEEWKDVVGYEGLYLVSNLGRVCSLDKYAKVCGGSYRLVKGKDIAINKYSNGYSLVMLGKNKTYSSKLVHRLVAQAFIPNPDNLPQVNHKDENIENNCVDNLEWCTSKYNANYGTRNYRCREKHRHQFKPVYQISIDTGEVIKTWDCMSDAGKAVGISPDTISRVCKGKLKTGGGYYWKFVKEEGSEG